MIRMVLIRFVATPHLVRPFNVTLSQRMLSILECVAAFLQLSKSASVVSMLARSAVTLNRKPKCFLHIRSVCVQKAPNLNGMDGEYASASV